MAWLEPVLGECELLWSEAKWLARAASSGSVEKLASDRAGQAIARIGIGSAGVQAAGSLVIDSMNRGIHALTHGHKAGTGTKPKVTTTGGTTTTTRRKNEHNFPAINDYAGFAHPVYGLVKPDTFLGVGPQLRFVNSALVLKADTRRQIQRVLDSIIDTVQHTVDKKRKFLPDSALPGRGHIRNRVEQIQDVVRHLDF